MRGYLVAAALGYVAGILWAPRKGELLRNEIKEHFFGLQQAGLDVLGDAQHRGSEVIRKAIVPTVEQVKEEAQSLKHEGIGIVQDLSQSAKDAMERGKTAVEASGTRLKEKTSAALTVMKDEAEELRKKQESKAL